MSVPVEILKKVQQIEIQIRKKVNHLFQGEYRSAFKGQGITFADFREYIPGDDIRAISWILTARTGRTYVKQFEEERELSVLLVVDRSGSCEFGSQNFEKNEISTYIAATLAASALKNKDLVGLLLFSDQIEHWVPPKKGRNQLLRLIRDLVYIKPQSRKSNLIPALIHLNKVLKKKSLIFIISDFIDMPDFSLELRKLNQKHEIFAFSVEDFLEKQMLDLGLIGFFDQEYDYMRWLPCNDYQLIQEFEKQQMKRVNTLKKTFNSCGVPFYVIPNNEKWDQILISFFRKKY